MYSGQKLLVGGSSYEANVIACKCLRVGESTENKEPKKEHLRRTGRHGQGRGRGSGAEERRVRK